MNRFDVLSLYFIPDIRDLILDYFRFLPGSYFVQKIPTKSSALPHRHIGWEIIAQKNPLEPKSRRYLLQKLERACSVAHDHKECGLEVSVSFFSPESREYSPVCLYLSEDSLDMRIESGEWIVYDAKSFSFFRELVPPEPSISAGSDSSDEECTGSSCSARRWGQYARPYSFNSSCGSGCSGPRSSNSRSLCDVLLHRPAGPSSSRCLSFDESDDDCSDERS
jgi:hypothetical protein